MKHSTSKPTKEEAAYISAVKDAGRCMACEAIAGDDRTQGCDQDGVDFHHFKSGNIRRGHIFGVGLCLHHHRGHPLPGYTAKQMREAYGPSLMDGGKAFAAAFGTDDELLERQRRYLEGE